MSYNINLSVFKKIILTVSALLLINSCIILPSNTLMQARKKKTQYVKRLLHTQPDIVFGKHGFFNSSCGSLFESNICFGRYVKQDSLFLIKRINKNCGCFDSKRFIYEDSTFYEMDSLNKISSIWYVE